MSIPIKLALLWHQHQPFYKSNGSMQLPWVRLHATKDYLEMAQHLANVPKMHATINLVPSLISQIGEYLKGGDDPLLRAARKPTESLSEAERVLIIHQCFHASEHRMIARSERYRELRALSSFTTQDLLDLIVHFHLAWTGEFSRNEEPFASLIQKDRHFTEAEKRSLLDAQMKILAQVEIAHMRLAGNANVELSSTPYYHPILPLLCDTNSALEAIPDMGLPAYRFTSIDDANEQISRAISLHNEHFGLIPRGMWPAEGSISDAALSLLSEAGMAWTASDETVLAHSLADSDHHFGNLEKYFPRQFPAGDSSITIFFRDHQLSDKIGFDYQSWQAGDAVADFMNHVKYVRSEILRQFGEEALLNACVSVILDGENCWEQYERNGYEFLNQLYQALSTDEEIEPVTMSEALEKIGKDHIRHLHHVVAGSWIDGNFRIWIGHPEKNRAWDLLAEAREELSRHQRSEAGYDRGRTALLQAEGSDWFWWFGDDHFSEDRALFDDLFRQHLGEMYDALAVARPESLARRVIGEQTNATFGAMHRSQN